MVRGGQGCNKNQDSADSGRTIFDPCPKKLHDCTARCVLRALRGGSEPAQACRGLSANAFSTSKYDRKFDIARPATLPVTLPARTQDHPIKPNETQSREFAKTFVNQAFTADKRLQKCDLKSWDPQGSYGFDSRPRHCKQTTYSQPDFLSKPQKTFTGRRTD